MKDHILIPVVKGVSVAIAKAYVPFTDDVHWSAYLINDNDFSIKNIIVSTTGYSPQDAKEPVKTSTLRHFIDQVEPHSFAEIEKLDPAIFALVNEFWVSYYLGDLAGEIYDKKFIFLQDSVNESCMQYIDALQLEGILHA